MNKTFALAAAAFVASIAAANIASACEYTTGYTAYKAPTYTAQTYAPNYYNGGYNGY